MAYIVPSWDGWSRSMVETAVHCIMTKNMQFIVLLKPPLCGFCLQNTGKHICYNGEAQCEALLSYDTPEHTL